MVTVGEATEIILNHLFTPGTQVVDVVESAGRVLAESVAADRDFPPFNRVTMDGIAISFQTWSRGRRTFRIEGIQAAGENPKTLADPENCLEVMTGAVLPSGCDAVIRYEDVEISDVNAFVKTDNVVQWQSIHAQGIDAKKDHPILVPGQRLAPSEIALLASVGKSKVHVFTLPKVAVISTGDELVGIDQIPAPWQIRRSNSYALQSAVRETGADATCFHLEDDRSMMMKRLPEIMRDFDVLILSGGVSKGKFDFVPQVLDAAGIEKLFHEVSQRPGKPFWFGRSASGKVAFALPGNPVSTFMCFYRYVRPWILKSVGAPTHDSYAILGKDFSFAPPLTCFLQVSVRNERGKIVAYPHPGGGSGDFANLRDVDGFLELPPEKSAFEAGQVFPYLSFRH